MKYRITEEDYHQLPLEVRGLYEPDRSDKAHAHYVLREPITPEEIPQEEPEAALAYLVFPATSIARYIPSFALIDRRQVQGERPPPLAAEMGQAGIDSLPPHWRPLYELVSADPEVWRLKPEFQVWGD